MSLRWYKGGGTGVIRVFIMCLSGGIKVVVQVLYVCLSCGSQVYKGGGTGVIRVFVMCLLGGIKGGGSDGGVIQVLFVSVEWYKGSGFERGVGRR